MKQFGLVRKPKIIESNTIDNIIESQTVMEKNKSNSTSLLEIGNNNFE